MKLDYFQDGRFYNGLLSKQIWQNGGLSGAEAQRSYLYDYDKANRLRNGIYSGQSPEDYSVPKITYDANGNVDSLQRFGETAPSTFGLIDDLKYNYPTYSNKLTAIDDNANSTKGFVNSSGSTDFTYYTNGFQKSDANKDITNIEYNYLGLIDKVHFGSSKRIENTYTSDGQKLKTLFISGIDTLKKEYVGDLIYINDTLRSIWHDEGRIIFDPKFNYAYWSDTLGNNFVDSSFTFNPQYQYFINDHLGSPRVVFQKLNDSLFIAQRINYGVTGDIISTDSSCKNLLNHFLQGKEWIDGFGYDFVTRTYDPYTMRMLQIDGANQFASGYTGLGNSPQMGIDPDGQVFFIIPQIGWSKKGGLNLGLEIGVGVPGALSASITGGYNFGSKQGYWSAQGFASGFYAGYGSQGGFGGWGYRYAGFSAGVNFGREGLGVGVSYGGTTSNNFNGAVNIGWSQKGGLDYGVNGGYTRIIEKPTVNKILEYNLKNAPSEPMQQKGGFDCLICASTFIDQMAKGRSYDEIMAEFGSLYDSEKGTSTQAALEKIFGTVEGKPSFSPTRDGKFMESGNPVLIAQNSNHAIVPTKVEVFTKTYKHNLPKTLMKIHYMNPATGSFQTTGMVKSYNYPTFLITIKR
jgi:hypothetical protein